MLCRESICIAVLKEMGNMIVKRNDLQHELLGSPKSERVELGIHVAKRHICAGGSIQTFEDFESECVT